MVKMSKTVKMLGLSAVLWAISMGFLYKAHYVEKTDEELGYLSSDVRMESEERQYYNIFKDSNKVGYRSEVTIKRDNLIISAEENVIKMNLAGLSREVFFHSVIAIDSISYVTKQMEFTIRSGSHSSVFSGSVRSDTLYIEVQNFQQASKRQGFFLVDENITFPVGVPFYIQRSEAATMSLMAFDPVIFSDYLVDCARRQKEIFIIDDMSIILQRYDITYKNRQASIWLDNNGRVAKADGYMFFGGELGNLSIENTSQRDVFLLPLEVTLGNDFLKELAITPDKPIHNPRNVEYMKVQLDGIRTAHIDITSSNKEKLSNMPVIYNIYNKPIVKDEEKQFGIQVALIDTSLTGTSDYIHPKDARIIRTAKGIISAGQDTLAMARAINRWVYDNMKEVKRLDLVRSVDILRELKGGCEEYTKLFTALARSIGILTQINMGLVYHEDGKFRYHSWPSVFHDGVWHDLDPFFGQDAADATHVTLVRGDYDRLVELLRTIGRISVKILDYR